MTLRPLKRVANQTRDRAKGLRFNATYPEQRLWSILCRRQLGGLKFRRQHPIEPYIIDFYCPSAKLAVELDGESHDGRHEYDAKREDFLRRLEIKIVRVLNDEVLNNLDGVAHFILQEAGQLSTEPSPNPSL
jgi:ATP-dependent DNA helicase RecQ